VNKSIAELNHPLTRGLVAAALNPGLRSILVFDATISMLNAAAADLKLMLEQVTDDNIEIVQLGVVQTEEDLWGQLLLKNRQIAWQAGSLASGRGQELRLVVIPDLTRLSMAAARACVTLIGSETAHLERHGKQEAWRPNLCWLAGCPSQHGETGLVSPHLLDRFALRLSDRVLVKGDDSEVVRQERVREIRDLIAGTEQPHSPSLSPELIERLQQAKQIHSSVTLESERWVVDYFDCNESYSLRRELALLRLAQVNARLAGSSQVRQSHVDLAAKTIGLKLRETSEPETLLPESEEESESETFSAPSVPATDLDRQDRSSGLKQPESKPMKETVYPADTEEKFPEQDIPFQSGNPYREDDAPVQREAASLRLPLHRLRSVGQGRGAIIGVEPATIVEDLAIVSTLLEATKYQQIRRLARKKKRDRAWKFIWEVLTSMDFGAQSESRFQEKYWISILWLGTNIPSPEKGGLIFQAQDLRRYRRAVVPEQMLAMVVDYTCLRESKWQDALLPYLQWAYIERASVCLIQIGAADPKDELRAERVTAKNVLVPQISNKLEAGAGKATPLAHGLDLTLESLRHALQHGRSTLEQVVLVVITDGRGNVPLQASQGSELVFPVGRQGIEDALEVARQIAVLNKVKAVVLNPQPKKYSDLPIILAQALGAKIAEIEPIQSWEVDER
jgi:magnesium chelatase subunit D